MFKNPDPKLTEQEAAEYLKISMYWLQKARSQGLDGPEYEYIGYAVRYRKSKLDEYVASNTLKRKGQQLPLPFAKKVAQ